MLCSYCLCVYMYMYVIGMVHNIYCVLVYMYMYIHLHPESCDVERTC